MNWVSGVKGPAHTATKFHEAGGATIEMPLEVFDVLTNEMAWSARKNRRGE